MEAKSQEELNAEAKAKSVEIAKARAEQLTKEKGRTVHPIVLGDAGEYVGFVMEPRLQAKKAAFDKVASDNMSDAGEAILTSSLIKEESAPEFILGKNDDVYLSACVACIRLVKVYHNAFKKK